AENKTVQEFVRKYIKKPKDAHPLEGSESLMEALRAGVEIATSATFSRFPFAVSFASILQGCSPTDHPMVSALKALPDTVVDLRTLLLFLSSRNYVRSPMVVALSLFHAYQFTPQEYVKDSYIGYVHRMAELYKPAPV
ncbi:MAG: hypothetical protein AN485_24700, partial [Anabaena sp. MDT14b]